MPTLISQETLRRGTPTRNGAAYPRPPHVSVFAVAFGRRMNTEGRTAQRRIEVARDLLKEVAALVAAHPEHRDAARSLIAPVVAAIEVTSPTGWTAALRLRTAEADIAEDLARVRYDADKSEVNRKAWQVAAARQAVASHELAVALESAK